MATSKTSAVPRGERFRLALVEDSSDYSWALFVSDGFDKVFPVFVSRAYADATSSLLAGYAMDPAKGVLRLGSVFSLLGLMKSSRCSIVGIYVNTSQEHGLDASLRIQQSSSNISQVYDVPTRLSEAAVIAASEKVPMTVYESPLKRISFDVRPGGNAVDSAREMVLNIEKYLSDNFGSSVLQRQDFFD